LADPDRDMHAYNNVQQYNFHCFSALAELQLKPLKVMHLSSLQTLIMWF